MVAVIPSVQDILSLDLIPIVLNTTYEIEAFVMGYHVYKNTWTPFVGEALDVAMQPDNKMDKYAVAIFQERKNKVIGHLPLGKSGKFAKTIFYFLKADKENKCKVVVTGKVVNKNDGLGMKVPSRLIFTAEEKYINILKERLAKML